MRITFKLLKETAEKHEFYFERITKHRFELCSNKYGNGCSTEYGSIAEATADVLLLEDGYNPLSEIKLGSRDGDENNTKQNTSGNRSHVGGGSQDGNLWLL